MYNLREKNLKNFKHHLLHPIGLEISAAHESLPSIGENWTERWCSLPSDFADAYDRIWNFEIHTDDNIVLTFIKSGTTWTQEAVWLLMNNLDFAKAKEIHLHQRSAFLDFTGLCKSLPFDTIDITNEMPRPRLIKTHLPANLLPKQIWEKKPKIIYIARNLKDVVVSSYHFLKGINFWTGGNIHEFVVDFLNNECMYTPYWPHIVDFWKLRNEPNICFLTYEDMKRDLAAVLQKLCRFLDRPELTSEEMKATLEHLSFKNMKGNNSINLTKELKEILPKIEDDFQFMRRGEFGAYKDELSPEDLQMLNDYTRKFLSKHNIKEEDIFGDT